MPNIYSLIQPGQTINSGSFLKNDKTKKNQVTLSDIRMASIRDFDTVPTPMSSAFMEKGSEVRDGILSAYSQYGSAMKYDPALRSTVDLAMSLVMNQPYDKVARNHDAYVRIFSGQDLDDKTLGDAMVDAWNSDQVATDIATLQRRKDATDDEDEIARLEEQIQQKEREAIRLGDYTDRAGIKGWFGNQLVKTMQIAPQVIEGATQSMLYSLAFAGLSALLTPAGATTILGGSGIAGASSMLNYMRSLASTWQGAGQIGSAVGTASYLAQTVLPREYGTMSRQLEQFLDSNDMHMDKETRKRAATIYALASTAIEFMTPEPGFGKMLMGVAPESLLQNSFKGWLKRVGVNMLEGAASESIEEALQDFVGSFVQDAAAIASDRKGTTHYNIESLTDSMPKYFAQAGKTLIDTFVPSLLVGLPGSITSANVASYLTDYRNMRDMAYRAVSAESRNNALNAQQVNARSVIVSTDIIDFSPRSSKEFAAQVEASMQDNESSEPAKLDPVKVRFDRERGHYVPVDEYNENLAKYLYVDLKNDAIAVDIVNDGAVRMTSDDIRNAAEVAGGAARNGTDLVFRNQDDAYRFAQSINDSSVMYRDANGQLTLEYTDTEGNLQIAPIEIDENADIAGMVSADAQRRGAPETQQADSVQDTGNQTTVQEMADAIRTASRKHISENTATTLARLFEMLPENVRNTIFSTNNGRLVITDSEYERITGRKLGSDSRAAAWLNRLQMVFTGRSDASSFVHEMGHIALIANPELAEGVRLAFAVNLDTEEGLNTFLDFIDENKDIIRVSSKEAAINLLREIGNVDGGNVFTDSAEELLISMLEAHFRTDLKGQNAAVLPQQVRDIFQRIANAIRRIYGRATGKTELPRDVQDAFNSFFWNGESLTPEGRNDILNQRGLDDERSTAIREGQINGRGDDLGSNRRSSGRSEWTHAESGMAQGLSGGTRLSEGPDNGRHLGRVRLLESVISKNKGRYVEINQIPNSDAQSFHDALENVQKTNPKGLYVSLYSVEEYSDPSIRLFMSEDKSIGFAIKSDGDIVSVFSDSTKARHPKAVYSILMQAIENGGTKLDCYGYDLLKVYMRMGFVPQGKVAYNPEYESAEWTARKDALGEPPVFALYYGDSSVDETLSMLDERMNEITDESIKEIKDGLREYTDTEVNGETIYGYDQLMAERDESLARLSMPADEIRSQQSLGESAVDRGERRFMRMDDNRFERSIEKDIFLPEYVVKAKLSSENETVVELAKRELDDRDKFLLLSPAEVSALYDTDSADEYVSRMKTEGSLSLADETQTERVYRKAWSYAHTMTPKEAVNSFKQRFNTLPRLMELKRILGPRRIQARSSNGRTYTRMFVPQNSLIYQKLSRLTADSPISEVNEVLSSMDSNPRAWLHAYQDAVNSGARIEGTLSSDQDIIDSYVDMADADFDIIKNELRRGEEPYGVSYDTVYGVSDADIVNLSAEEAERQSREAGNTAEDESAGSGANPSERAKDLQKSLKIASTAASRAQDRVRTLEGQMDSLRQRHEASEQRMHENLQVLRKVARSKTKEVESLRAKLGNALTRENDTRHEYAERLKKTERELRTANNEVKRAEKRLEDSRASFERRMNDMREKVSAARQEAHSQEVRANKLDRLLKAMATRTQSDRITRAIKGRLSINSKTHDVAMLEEPLYYIYYLMHNGQNRRYSQYQSTENMPDFDYDMEVLRGGLSKGLEEVGEDGSIQSVIIDLGHTDKDGNPVIAYSGNLGTYRYSRKNIPERLRSRLSADTISALESDGPLRWSGLTVAQKRDIYDALVRLKQEAATSRAEINDAQMFSRRSLAREAARTAMGSAIPKITDEMRESVKQYMQSQDHSYNGTPTDEDVWDHIARHPDLIMNEVKPGKLKKALDTYGLSFLKIQRLARILDGGKDDGPFQRIFVRSFQEAYDKVLSNTDRRMERFYKALEGLIGEKGSEKYRKHIEALSKDTIHFKTNALVGEGVDAKLSEAMAMYIYSQNINGATKLVSDEGNNLSLEDLARINPEKMAEYLDLEIQMRADKGRDDSHPTPFNTFREEDIVKLRDRLSKGEFGESVVPEWVRGIGDMMIDQLALETPRIAQAAYTDYNVMLQIQDRYFPLVQASRGSWGDILFGTGKKKGVASVDSGSLKIRQKNARYPLMLDPFSVFFSAIREQENLINMSKPVSDAAYLMKFGGVGDVVRNRFGEKWSRALNDYLQRIANPENRLTDVEKIMNRFLGNAAAAKIGLNLMTGVKQFVSVIPAAVDGELSPADIVRGISHILSPSLRGELREQMDRVAYSVVRSGYDPDISRLRRMEDFSRLGQLNQKFVDVSTWLTQRGDEISKMLIWSAKYDKEIRANKSEADAAYAATDLVNRTMSVTSPIAMSEAQTGRNPLWRAFFMFTNDLFQMWNVMYADIPMDLRNKEYGKAFSRFGGLALSAAALSLLAGGWLPDDDDEERFDASAFLDDFFQNFAGYAIPLFGQQVQDWSRGYAQSLITAPGEVFSMGRMVWKGLWNEKDYTADQYLDQLLDALLAGGELVGVPATGIKRPAQSVYDFDTGEWRLNPAYLFGVRWGDGMPNLIRLLSD